MVHKNAVPGLAGGGVGLKSLCKGYLDAAQMLRTKRRGPHLARALSNLSPTVRQNSQQDRASKFSEEDMRTAPEILEILCRGPPVTPQTPTGRMLVDGIEG